MRWWYRLAFAESTRLVDGVGCPCDRVINAGYCYWYVLVGIVVPRCVLFSVACPTNLSVLLSTRHVLPANLNRRPTHCNIVNTLLLLPCLQSISGWGTSSLLDEPFCLVGVLFGAPTPRCCSLSCDDAHCAMRLATLHRVFPTT